MTETPPADEAVDAGAVSSPTPLGWIDTEDHKRVGRLLVGTSLVFILLALVLQALVSLEGADAAGFVLLDGDTFSQVRSLALDGLVMLGVIPLFLGIAAYVVPLQLGAPTLAFPRAAAAGFWGYVVGGALLVSAYAINGGPAGGADDGVELYLAALGMVALSLTLVAICVVSTVISLRAPGLDLGRLPLFSWSSFAAGMMLIITLPMLAALALLLFIDHRYGRVLFGGNLGVADHLDYLYILPSIAVVAVPGLGVLLEAVPVAARRRLVGTSPAQIAIGLVAISSFGVFANQALVDNVFVLGDSGRVILEEALYIGLLGLGAVATLATVGVAARNLGKISPSSLSPALALALVSALMLLGGLGLGAGGALIDATLADGDFKLRDTAWRNGIFALVVLGGGLGGLVAGALWWFPKMWGRHANVGLSWLASAALVGGVTLVAVPSLVAGSAWELPHAEALHEGRGASEALAAVGAVGVLIVVVAVALLMLNLFVSVLAAGGAEAADDPYGGHTLEWATSSPPPAGNFTELPEINSDRPLLDASEEASS